MSKTESVRVAVEDADQARDLLGLVVNSLFGVGLSLQYAAELPDMIGLPQISEALQRLDDIIGEIRDYVFADPAAAGRQVAPHGDRGAAGPLRDRDRSDGTGQGVRGVTTAC